MEPVTEPQIRRSLVNSSRGEAAALALPRNFGTLDWAALDFLGWRDPKAPLRGYLVRWRDGRPLGVLLRAAESRMSRKVTAMCLLCRSAQGGDNVSLFAARRVGAAGRNGNTVGTYMCADLACSGHVRLEGPSATVRTDPGLTVDERIAGLEARTDAFLDELLRAD